MGYKLAGFDVVGNVEIDKKINDMYCKNNKPRYSFCMDIRDFLKKEDLPDELFNLDILDGSPPCSTFSMAGQREGAWNKEKKFREGQKKQRLDDLFFWFIDVAERLQPKVIVAENVPGIVSGNAKGYCVEIIKRLSEIGYKVQMFCLNAATMGVPQSRERVFFICRKKVAGWNDLKLEFHEKPILFGEVRSEAGEEYDLIFKQYLTMYKHGDKTIEDIKVRLGVKKTGFNHIICADDEVCATIACSCYAFRAFDKMKMSEADLRAVSTFPQDYDFCGVKPKYACGMSVPPVMMAQVSSKIYEQWLS